MRLRHVCVTATLLLAAAGPALARQGTQQPSPLKRTILQTQPLSVAGREATTALAELIVGGTAPRHTHPGEELGYVLEGTATLLIDGKPSRELKPGDVFFIPAGAVHSVRNTGTVPWKIVGNFFLEAGKPIASPVP